MPRTVLVTAADAGYFDLLRDLLLSVAAARPPDHAGAEVAVGVFDLGLTAGQRAWLDGRVMQIVQPGWDLAVPAAVRAARPHARALTVRPFLPQHFRGYETYLWVDADVWLQNWRGIEFYCRGARVNDVAATPHTDRAYPFRQDVFRHRHKALAAGFGKAEADTLALQQHLNAGVFAARADSPLWARWAEAFQQSIDTSAGAEINDQTALNFAWHRRGLSVHLLPAWCNWQCHLAVPAWRPRDKLFCEPFLPHAPVAMMHLTHASKNAAYELVGLDGKRHRLTLRYPGGQPAAETAV